MSGQPGLSKRASLEKQLSHFNRSLIRHYGRPIEEAGHCLLLGRHYAESPYIYFSLNPGFARDGSPLDPSSIDGSNVPFSNPPHLCRKYIYLHNSQRFFQAHAALGAWINAKVTSAFLVPWRTRNVGALYTLNRLTDGRVFHFARRLVELILLHHEARLLITAGKSSLTLLTDLGVFAAPPQIDRFLGPGGSYQWSRSTVVWRGSNLTILQIPHFSRANSPDKMKTLAEWLTAELDPFGLTPITISRK